MGTFPLLHEGVTHVEVSEVYFHIRAYIVILEF